MTTALLAAGVGATALAAQTASVPQGSPLQPAPAATAPAATAPLLPLHSRDPLRENPAEDPLLRLAEQTAPVDLLRRVVAETIARAPAAEEAAASRDEASAAVDEARARNLPSVDFTLSSYKVISRNFGNNPENVIEQARPGRRTDMLLSADLPLLDAGGSNARVSAARARLRGADDEVETAADRIALETIASWYDVFTYRSLVAISTAFAGSQRELRGMVQERIRRGASAEADLARVDSYIASADARLARFRRLELQANARYEALTGRPPPPGLARAPFAGAAMSRDLAVVRAAENPQVRAARAVAEAAGRDAKAAKSDTFPTLSAGIDAGRYGIYETPRDYDVRGRLTIRQRIFGGVTQRYRQAEARARSADARADRVGIEAERDAEIAWSDVSALEEQRQALQNTYLASRRSRDTIAERFRVATGTLFDVIGAEDSYFETAAAYLQSVTELDAARYVLLSRTGTLLSTLGVAAPATADPYRITTGREP